jgi:hypothetical protein
MSTLVKPRRKNLVGNTKFRRAYVPTTALAKVVKFDEELMHVHLTVGNRRKGKKERGKNEN